MQKKKAGLGALRAKGEELRRMLRMCYLLSLHVNFLVRSR